MAELVRVEMGDGSAGSPLGVATVRLERAPMNALNTQMQEELRAAAAQLRADDSVRAVVLYGGEKVFAAGADVKEFAGQDHAKMMRDADRLSSSLAAIAALPKPVIAAVTGYALGGGCELALTADFRVSADNARWGQPEILLGIIPGAGGTQRLPRLIGPAKAKDLIYSGRFVAIDAGLDGDLGNGLRLESHLFASLFATADRAIGMKSFIEDGPGKARFTDVPTT